MQTESEQWYRLFHYVNGGTEQHDERLWSYCGFDIWPIIKAQVLTRGSNILNAGRQMSVAKMDAPASTSSRSLLRWLPRVAKPRPSAAVADKTLPSFDWPELPWFEEPVDVLCLGYATNHKKLGSNYFQLCMDPLRLALDHAGRSSACLITGLDNDHEGISQAALKGVRGIDQQFRAVRRMERELPPVELLALPGFAAWWDGLGSVLEGRMFITIEHLESVVKQTAATGAWLHHYLVELRPKAVLVSAYYGLMGHGGSWACRRLGIPIADVQHGVAGSQHHAYSWPEAPRAGFNTLPTAFLTWSEREQREMARVSEEWQPSLLPIGNVWRLLDEMIERPGKRSLFRRGALTAARDELKRDRRSIREIKKKQPGDKDILLALHPDESVPWLPRLRRLTPDDWRFWIRLHPGEFKNNEAFAQRLRELADERTFIIEPSLVPLNVILSEVDAILTKYSSVALDARAYGVPTVAYSEAGRWFLGNPEVHRVSYVAPFPERMRVALSQRLSSYSPSSARVMPEIQPLDVLGPQISQLLEESVGSNTEALL